MCVCWLVALKIQLTIKVLPYQILLLLLFLLLFSVPFSLRSFTNSSWEAEILPDPTSTIAHSSAKAHGKENRANRAKPCAATWGRGESVAVREVSVLQLVKSGFQAHIPTEIRTRTRKRQMHTALGALRSWYTLYCVYILKLYDLYKIYKSIVHIIIKCQL